LKTTSLRKSKKATACVRGEDEEPAMSRVRRKKSPNEDLIEAAEGQLHNILVSYKRFENNRPVMLLDLPSGEIYAYPYAVVSRKLAPSTGPVALHCRVDHCCKLWLPGL
jgi:hypothetical protein